MTDAKLSDGTVHELPTDLRNALSANSQASKAWTNITPLARNEWICWVESVKLDETRQKHLDRAVSELASGKHRPCCWAGCPHR